MLARISTVARMPTAAVQAVPGLASARSSARGKMALLRVRRFGKRKQQMTRKRRRSRKQQLLPRKLQMKTAALRVETTETAAASTVPGWTRAFRTRSSRTTARGKTASLRARGIGLSIKQQLPRRKQMRLCTPRPNQTAVPSVGTPIIAAVNTVPGQARARGSARGTMAIKPARRIGKPPKRERAPSVAKTSIAATKVAPGMARVLCCTRTTKGMYLAQQRGMPTGTMRQQR
mmetsp:Transcript_27/g.76  ORF Transcript_27/g.76 Transcript_27/m.76 type:complete len:232 (-) Transcript_27:965-1660(-)